MQNGSTRSDDSPSLVLHFLPNGTARLLFSGTWRLGSTPSNLETVLYTLEGKTPPAIELAAEELDSWDSSLLAVAVRMTEMARQGGFPCDDAALPEGARNLIRLALAVPRNADAKKHAAKTGFFAVIGNFVLGVPQTVNAILAFIGELTLSVGRFFSGRAACSRHDILLQIQECGAEALPIVSLISLLVGFILAFVGVVQLRMFGAEIYVSSLVAIGMTRIMGAIMTGIIMAGRTGASFAAVIGTMQVNEEVDALSTQGIPPSDFLVLPRVLALSLTTPLLVLYADLMGILGGFIVGVGMLGLDPVEYFTFTKTGFGLNHLWVGVVHGFVFGIVVSITGCYQGLRCGRSAAAVGNATTSAVVCSIVGIVISTSILTVICNVLGI